MQPNSPLLVPLDGSAGAEAALLWAKRFVLAFNQRLVLLRLVPPRDLQDTDDPSSALRAVQHYLDGVALSLRGAAVEVEVRATPVDAHISEGITGMATALRASLIAIAGHGRSGPERWVQGSVVDEVTRTASQPVLVVRPLLASATQLPAIRRILLPLDGSTLGETAIPEAERLAAAFDATLDLVRLVPWSVSLIAAPSEDAEREASMYLREIQSRLPDALQSERHLGQYMLHSNPADGIVNLAHWTGANLILMTTHGRSGWRRWVLGSVADAVTRSSECPVYLLRPSSALEHANLASR